MCQDSHGTDVQNCAYKVMLEHRHQLQMDQTNFTDKLHVPSVIKDALFE